MYCQQYYFLPHPPHRPTPAVASKSRSLLRALVSALPGEGTALPEQGIDAVLAYLRLKSTQWALSAASPRQVLAAVPRLMAAVSKCLASSRVELRKAAFDCLMVAIEVSWILWEIAWGSKTHVLSFDCEFQIKVAWSKHDSPSLRSLSLPCRSSGMNPCAHTLHRCLQPIKRWLKYIGIASPAEGWRCRPRQHYFSLYIQNRNCFIIVFRQKQV
jgi:hypothetical protein